MTEWEWQALEDHVPVAVAELEGRQVAVGSLVRLRPRAGGDVIDLALAGKLATIESIEKDYEGRLHFAVVLEDDPGRDLGMLRQPGHRFFFDPTELETSDQ
jgi:hypothetical protein